MSVAVLDVARLCRRIVTRNGSFAEFEREACKNPIVAGFPTEELRAQLLTDMWERGLALHTHNLEKGGVHALAKLEDRKFDPPENVADFPRRDFLYGRIFARHYVTATVAPGGGAKTALSITEALAMTSGVPLLGDRPVRPLFVCLWNCEDPREEIMRRILAARQFFADQLEGTGWEDRLTVLGAEDAIELARIHNGAVKLDEEVVTYLIEQLTGFDVLLVDPFSSTHAVPENDNTAINIVVKRGWARVARGADIAIGIAHHLRKPPPARAAGDKAFPTMGRTIDDTRGASALIDAARMGRVINRLTPELAPKLGIAPSAAWRYLRVDDGKANLAPLGAATWRELVSVDLPNRDFDSGTPGDDVGVIRAWTPPELGETDRDERALILEALGDREWRASPKAKEGWVGEAFAAALGLDLKRPEMRAEVLAKVNAAIKAGWLVEEKAVVNRNYVPVLRARRQRISASIADLTG